MALTVDQVRRVALWRQGFTEPIGGVTASRAQRLGRDARAGLVGTMLDHLGAVQLDTISVLARSHELVAYSRLGAIGRPGIEQAYWGLGRTFEYWSHAACILPMEAWPHFAFRRRHFARRGVRWHDVPQAAVREVLVQLDAEGPLTTTHIGGAKRGGEWWDWSDAKVAIEWLLDIGTVVVTRRSGWRREYDLAERAVPVGLRSQPGWAEIDGIVGPGDDACRVELVRRSAAVLGVGTTGDVADVHRLSNADVERHATDAGLIPVTVEGWTSRSWATPEALGWLDGGAHESRRTTLLSPFDSLIWHRPRTERLFGMAHRLEAYTPAHKRVHGYFAMPVLHGGRLVARVDPKRDGSVLQARRVTFADAEVRRDGSVRRAAIAGTTRALREAARWVGADDVVIDDIVPASAAPAVRQSLAAGG